MGQRSIIGTALQVERKAQGLTQAALAELAGIGISAVQAIERGHGRLSTLWGVLAALKLELRGRTLIAGPIGSALATARKRREQSLREIARALGVSRNTLAALEGGAGLVSTLEAYAGSLGAGLYLASPGEERPFFRHAGNSSAHHGWETPAALAALLTEAVGIFDLDPCAASTHRRRARIKARILLTAEDNGLAVPWRGHVFVNPPYGRSLKLWVRKCAEEAATSNAVVIGLLPARPDTRWWHDEIAGKADVFMLRGRLQFGAGHQSAPFPSAIVVWGAGPELVTSLARLLVGAWHIPVTHPVGFAEGFNA